MLQDFFFSLLLQDSLVVPSFSRLKHSFIDFFSGKFILLTATFLLSALHDAPVTLRAPLEVR